jgi:hypothetical protein
VCDKGRYHTRNPAGQDAAAGHKRWRLQLKAAAHQAAAAAAFPFLGRCPVSLLRLNQRLADAPDFTNARLRVLRLTSNRRATSLRPAPRSRSHWACKILSLGSFGWRFFYAARAL